MRRTLVEKCVQEITAVQFMPQERIQERIVEYPADIVVPPIQGDIVEAVQTAIEIEIEIVEVLQPSPQERTQERIGKQRASASEQ